MNKMMDMVAAAVMSVARSFNIQVSEAEVIQELSLWNYDKKEHYISINKYFAFDNIKHWEKVFA